ncbi:unnamed protein product, partial [Rotaria magnacalcarata]
MCAAATVTSYEGGSFKAFLAKAKDEFQVKYDKPGQ